MYGNMAKRSARSEQFLRLNREESKRYTFENRNFRWN